MSRSAVYGHGVPAAQASTDERAEFIRLTYLHLGGAVLAFTLLCAAIVNSPLAPWMMEKLAGNQMLWLVFLGLFMAVGWVADRWARTSSSPGMQYVGLGLYVVAEALIFTPLLYFAAFYAGPNVLPTAGLITGIVFAGLTAGVFVTKKDFSFLRQGLMVAGLIAMGLIVAGVLFGFNLGTFFSVAMVGLAAGYILYYTSNVLHHYPVGAHVAASLALFSAVALLFWYVLRLVMAFTSRD